MDGSERAFIFIHGIMIVLFLLLSVLVILFNQQARTNIIILCVIYLSVALFRHKCINFNSKSVLSWILPCIEFIIVFTIIQIDIYGTGLALLAVLAMDIVIDYSYKYSIGYITIVYIVYMYKYFSNAIDLPMGSKILVAVIGAFQFILYNGFAFLARKYSLQSQKLEKTTAELNAKMIDLEQMAMLKERNRIAGEIHNTVGHQLTTALIQIEATQMLVEKDLEEAKRRIGIIKGQVREGLKELRNSIHAINADQEYINFDDSIRVLLEQVKNHASIDVDCSIDDLGEVRVHLKKILYHIVLESITNAIRHGRCNKMVIRISSEQGIVNLHSFNNGIVPKDLNYGYGLNHIKENVKEWGGSLIMKINENGWFGMLVRIPISSGDGDISGKD